MNPDNIYILSAKYGLVKLDEEIEPYDVTLNKMSVLEKKDWSNAILNQLSKITDIDNTNFIFLAGENYRKYLTSVLPYHEVPMKGLQIGQQLNFLVKKLK
jgi:cytoplasmic iron level regulating protein YaaA (DUF328/UPF0246 family)